MELWRKIAMSISSSGRARRLLGAIAIGQGLGYWSVIGLQLPLTTSYQRQAAQMPLWAWGLLLVFLGMWVWLTGESGRRYTLNGRMAAIALLLYNVYFAVNFTLAGALTATGQYIPVCIVLFSEAVFLPRSKRVDE